MKSIISVVIIVASTIASGSEMMQPSSKARTEALIPRGMAAEMPGGEAALQQVMIYRLLSKHYKGDLQKAFDAVTAASTDSWFTTRLEALRTTFTAKKCDPSHLKVTLKRFSSLVKYLVTKKLQIEAPAAEVVLPFSAAVILMINRQRVGDVVGGFFEEYMASDALFPDPEEAGIYGYYLSNMHAAFEIASDEITQVMTQLQIAPEVKIPAPIREKPSRTSCSFLFGNRSC